VALVHTEGCGAAGHSTGALYHRTLLSYMAHPLVARGLFLEHGCEKTHNDYMRAQLADSGGDPAGYGWASVQMDGGLEAVLAKIEMWFRQSLAGLPAPREQSAGLAALNLGLLSAGPVPAALAEALARLTRTIVGAGGTVVVPQSATLLEAEAYREGTFGEPVVAPSLAYGRAAAESGFHLMACPSGHWVETLTGLGATGVEILLACPGQRTAQGHPLVPMLQVAVPGSERVGDGFDLTLEGDPDAWAEAMLRQVVATVARRYVPRLFAQGNVDFQITRGLLGVTV